MRRTITLDKDVAEELQAEMRRRRSSNFRETVNDVLRSGLMVRRDLAAAKPFKVRARRRGSKPGLNHNNIAALLEQLEGPGYK